MTSFPDLLDETRLPKERPSYPWLLFLLTLLILLREGLDRLDEEPYAVDILPLYAFWENPYIWAGVAVVLGLVARQWRDGMMNLYRLSVLLSFWLWYQFLSELSTQRILFEDIETFWRYRTGAVFVLYNGLLLLCLRSWRLRPRASHLWALWEYWGRLFVFISLWELMRDQVQVRVLGSSLPDSDGTAFLYQISRSVFGFGSFVLLILQQLAYTKVQRYKAWAAWLLFNLLLTWIWPTPPMEFPYYFVGCVLFAGVLGLCYTALGPDQPPVPEV